MTGGEGEGAEEAWFEITRLTPCGVSLLVPLQR